MTTAAGEEVAFTRGMEHEPEVAEAQKPVAREVTFSIARSLFSIQSMAHAAMDVVGALAGKVRSVAERGPEDYAPNGYAQGFRDGRRQVPPNFGGVNGSGSKLGWLITLNIAVTVAAASWVASTIIDQGKQIAVIQCQLNPQQCPQVNRGQP